MIAVFKLKKRLIKGFLSDLHASLGIDLEASFVLSSQVAYPRPAPWSVSEQDVIRRPIIETIEDRVLGRVGNLTIFEKGVRSFYNMKALSPVRWGSIAVSMDRLSLLDRLFITSALAGILVWAFPHSTYAQTVQTSPLVFEINDLSLFQNSETLQQNYLGQFLASDVPPALPDPRVDLLQAYLLSKNSPMADEAEVLLEQYHYRLILGISFAESNFCKHQIKPNNCWGIGGGKPETYPTLAHGIIRANNLIQKYQAQGMTTPKLMRSTWVGWHNDSWVRAVEQITKDLETRGL